MRPVTERIIMSFAWIIIAVLAVVILLHYNPLDDPDTVKLKKICGMLILGTIGLILTQGFERLSVLPGELWENRKLIWRLAKNDFRKRYAGSLFGGIWAMVQPVVTVLLYYVVFDQIFKQRESMAGVEIPYVLFLTAGLVPWFYFSEALSSGTASLLEYNYLVKKVVFKISVLPVIKIIAAMFTHVFFTVVLIVIALLYGCRPSLYWLQIPYYMICEFVFVLGLSYATCAITVYFRDLQQIIGIIMQVGMWATPILWNIERFAESPLIVFIKLNPMTYIVSGYRGAIYGEQWFFTHFYSSTYFWMFTILVFFVGSLIFKKLKNGFADIM